VSLFTFLPLLSFLFNFTEMEAKEQANRQSSAQE
jgi:hypothetical protein